MRKFRVSISWVCLSLMRKETHLIYINEMFESFVNKVFRWSSGNLVLMDVILSHHTNIKK